MTTGERPAPEPEPGSEPEPETVTETSTPGTGQSDPKPLRRSRSDRVLGGVCGGLGHYLGIDPVLVRIAALVLVVAGGAGILLYLIGWIAIPEESDAEAAARPQAVRHGSGAVAGILFVAVGGVLLLDQLLPDVFDWRFVGPLVLIGIGVALLAGRRR